MVESFRTGSVSLIGRPNVGKSSLLNQIIGSKVSITSPRPQTTRHRILGIKSTTDSQIMFVDTPGIQSRHNRAINRAAGASVTSSVVGVDLLALVISAKGWVNEDEASLRLVKQQPCPSILLINKVDLIKDKQSLLPLIDESRRRMEFAEILPVSAKTGVNVDRLLTTICSYLPRAEPGFPPDQITDKGDRFVASELVREQLFRQLGQELPYASAVEIERFQTELNLTRVSAVIWVEKAGQKAIVIGRAGNRLKSIGAAARRAMERRWQGRVHLELWVKIRAGWADNTAALRDLGYWEEF